MSTTHDETQPLLENPSPTLPEQPEEAPGTTAVPCLTGDPDNPSEWTDTYKRGIALLLACTCEAPLNPHSLPKSDTL